MALRNLRYEDDEILTKKSRPVKEITDNIIVLLDDMAETMYANNGVGLAAPQVGVLKRIVVIDVHDELIEFINPEIIETEGEQERTEACLSLPGKCATVVRPAYVKVRAMNRQGEIFEIDGTETLAVAFCHEIDHLDGILYKDRAVEGTFREVVADEEDED